MNYVPVGFSWTKMVIVIDELLNFQLKWNCTEMAFIACFQEETHLVFSHKFDKYISFWQKRKKNCFLLVVPCVQCICEASSTIRHLRSAIGSVTPNYLWWHWSLNCRQIYKWITHFSFLENSFLGRKNDEFVGCSTRRSSISSKIFIVGSLLVWVRLCAVGQIETYVDLNIPDIRSVCVWKSQAILGVDNVLRD